MSNVDETLDSIAEALAWEASWEASAMRWQPEPEIRLPAGGTFMPVQGPQWVELGVVREQELSAGMAARTLARVWVSAVGARPFVVTDPSPGGLQP